MAHVRAASPAMVGLVCALALMVLAMALPAILRENVQIGFAPIAAHWMPRIAISSIVAVAVAVLGVAYADRLTAALSWRMLLLTVWLVALVWSMSLALVDGRAGLSGHVDLDDLLGVARSTGNVSQLLHGFVGRITLGPDAFPTHVAGHPPGALLFFVLLVQLGLGGSLAAGLVVTVLASTIPVAVLVTLRTLRDEPAARLAAPFLVLAPAAIWEVVSGDAVYACVAAWGLAALAHAATTRNRGWARTAGAILGFCVMMSYGLPLLAILALAILIVARSFFPLLWAIIGALAVVLAFWLAGFSLWAAYPAIHDRYWAGIAHLRPASYWLWGDLAALCFSAGPVLGAAVGCWVSRVRAQRASLDVALPDTRAVTILGGAAMLCIVLADLSLMSKAEVERIWLPFVPWLLVMCALLPPRWRRPALAVQVVSALVVQHLFLTSW